MALNPEWNLEDTVRQIPTVIFSSSSESEGTVRVKKQEKVPERRSSKESPPVSIKSSSTSSTEEPPPSPSPKKVVPAAAVASKPVRAASPIRPTSNEAPVSEIAKSKRIYSTVGRILGDMKEQSQYQNSVNSSFLYDPNLNGLSLTWYFRHRY